MQRLVVPAHIEGEVRLFLFCAGKNIRIGGKRRPHEFPYREASLEFCRGFQIGDETRIETLDRRRQPDLGHQGFPRVDEVRSARGQSV